MKKLIEKFMSLKRRAMREEQRAKEAELPQALADAKKMATSAENFIINTLSKFQAQYNEFLMTAGPVTPADKVQFAFEVSETTSKESELRNGLSQVPEELFQKALREDGQPDNIRIMYLRLDKLTTLKEGHNVKKRPGAVESLEGNQLSQLVYHAAVILTNEQLLELELAGAKHKLCEDFINHLMFSGIQFQEMQNEKQWKQSAQEHTQALKTKMEEVGQVFAEAANMKVNQD